MKSYCPQLILNRARDTAGLIRQLRERGYQLGPGETVTGRRELYDTFDWRLFKNHLLLGHDPDGGATLFLFDAADAQLVSRDNTESVPRFYHEIEPVEMASCLAPITRERALSRLGCFALRGERRDISDQHGKIIARLYVERLTKTPATDKRTDNTLRVLRLQALKGYEGKTKRIFSLATEYCSGSASAEDLLSRYFLALDRTPGDYSSKLLVPLDRDMTISQAMSEILLFLLDMMERNTAGIRDDIDSEFLHEFRIAIRRSRSLVSGMKHVLPTQAEALGKHHFSWLSNQTSTLRDLDVFLLAFREYEQLLSEDMYAELLPLHVFLQQRKKTERVTFLSVLDSDRYREFVRDWRESMQENARRNVPGHLERPVISAAGDAIREAWKRMRKNGRRTANTGTDLALHDLRKSGKKLRYLLDTFRTLFPAGDVEKAIWQLRKIQNVLGDIVDYQVQQQFLREWQENFPGKQHRGIKVAMDRLRSIYSGRETAAKNNFQRRYEKFVSAENRKLFKSLSGKLKG